MVDLQLERVEFVWRELESVPCDLCGGGDSVLEVEENGFHIVRCRGCGLVFCNPRPTPAELRRFYDRYYAPESEDLWEVQMRRPFEREGLQFLASRSAPDRVLDVGCGCGFFLDMMRSAGWETTGVEVSAPAVRYAREELGLDVIQGQVEEAELPAESFGAATLWYVLEHVPNPSAVLAAAFAALRPGGVVLVRVPNRNVKIDRLLARLGAVGRRLFLICPPRHLFDYTPETLTRLLDKAGFRTLKTVNAIPRSAGSLAARVRRWLWRWKSEAVRALTLGRRLSGSSIVAYAVKPT